MAGVGASDNPCGSKQHPDREIARIAARQHGVVAAGQLVAIGLTRRQIQRSLDAGRLHPVHSGVYFVGYVPRHALARYMAAVLAVDGVASHRTAAALHGLWDHHRVPDVTSTAQARSPSGVRRHRTRALKPQDVTTRHGIPCTTLQRTLIDLADVLDADAFEAVLRRAEARTLVDRLDLRPIHGRRGAAKLKRAHELTRSGAERAFRRAVRAAQLPQPEYNARWNGWEIDVLWREKGLAVEIDGFAYHRSRDAFRRDRRKGNALAAAGLTLLRFTYEDVVDRPAAATDQVRRLLA
jgi:very-short-patch-repair endonuclease